MVGDTSRSGIAGYNTSGHAQETLHWSNGQVLFTTNAAGALDDLKIGTLADITSVFSKAGSTPGLTIWDREFDGRQSSYHSSAGNGPWYPPVADPAGGYNLTSKDARGVLFVQQNRTDDISDDTNVFQGDRVFDSTLGHWTTPDPYGGDINDPATLKAYLYDNNNAQSYQDGSGNLPVIGTVVANPAVSSNPIGIAVGVILIIGSYLGGPERQGLLRLPRAIHEQYHKGPDAIAPRFRGAAYYRSLGTDTMNGIFEDSIEYTKEFDAANGTNIFDAMVRAGFPGAK